MPECLVYTFEASFNGTCLENGSNKYFTESDYIDLGRDLVLAAFLTLCWKLEPFQISQKKEGIKKDQGSFTDIQSASMEKKFYYLTKSQKDYFARYIENYNSG